MSPISPDIQRAVEIIDQRIASLKTIREMLVREFALENGAEQKTAPLSISVRKPPERKTRKQLITEFLRTNGPHKRIEIEQKTGIPRGSVATTLNDPDTFERDDIGRWRLKSE